MTPSEVREGLARSEDSPRQTIGNRPVPLRSSEGKKWLSFCTSLHSETTQE